MLCSDEQRLLTKHSRNEPLSVHDMRPRRESAWVVKGGKCPQMLFLGHEEELSLGQMGHLWASLHLPLERWAYLGRAGFWLCVGVLPTGVHAVEVCLDAFFSLPTCCPLQILGYFDYAFTAIFTVEILLKVTAFSLILTYSKAAVAIIVAIFCLLSRC